MKKFALSTYLAASLALLVPVPGRLAYGIVLILAMNVSMITVTFFQRLVKLLSLENLMSVLTAMLLVSEGVLYKQLLIMYSPIMALTLGFAIYLPAVSSFFISRFYKQSREPVGKELCSNMKYMGQFSLFACIIFLLRDIIGYGTISLPSRNGIFQLELLREQSGKMHAGAFLATIPGAIVLCALVIAFILYVQQNLKIAKEYSDAD